MSEKSLVCKHGSFARSCLICELECERDRLLDIMRRLYESMRETSYERTDAPGHSHNVPGRWDHDGSECERCKAWSELKVAIDEGRRQ